MGYLSANPVSDADREMNLPQLQPKPAEKKPLIVFKPVTITSRSAAGTPTAAGMSPVMIAALLGMAAVFILKKGGR